MESIVVGMFDEADEALAFVNDLEARGVARDHIDMEGGGAEKPEPQSFFQRLGNVLTGADRGALGEGFRRGGTIVSARVDDPQVDETVYLMKAHGAVNIDERASGASGPNDQGGPKIQGEQRIPVVEEALKVGKRVVEKGGVRVYTQVDARPVEEEVTLRDERVVVERRPMNQPATGQEPGLFQEGTIELHERGEEVVVGKEARIIEEVVVGKVVDQRVETVRDTVRRTDVAVEDLGTATADPDRYGADFQQHWQQQYAPSGYPYEHYAPAYRYGSQLAGTEPYQGRPWDDIEVDAQKSWETHNPGTWERFKDAVRYGWSRMTGSPNPSARRDLP